MHTRLPRLAHAAVAAAAALMTTAAFTAPALAQTTVDTIAGDGGLTQQTCGTQPQQIRVDSSSVQGMSACFGLTAPTGWVAVNITGSYGVVNNLTVPVAVAFKLPDGAVYFQQIIQPGQVRSVDVDRRGSTIVELQVTPVATSTGTSTATLTPAADKSNVITLRSAGQLNPGRVLRISWAGVVLSALDRNSGFNDRLDASFAVVPALDGTQCVSLESAAYPGVFLTMSTTGAVQTATNPAPKSATWCASEATTTPTGVHLANASNQTRLLAAATGGKVTTSTTRSIDTVWFSDQALALPGK